MQKLALAGLLYLALITKVDAQNIGANWLLVYNKLMLTITPDSAIIDTLADLANGFKAQSSIANSAGDLLFFSHGVDARNKNGAEMDNGCCLCESPEMPGTCIAGVSGSPHMQGSLIIPVPGADSLYYLFIKDKNLSPNGQPARVQASLVDLRFNSGLGRVTSRSIPILLDTLSDSRMTACKHANGRDWWLVNFEYKTNKIYTHLITPDSIYGPFEQSIGLFGNEPDAFGYSLFSQDGSILANVTLGMPGITLLSFDRCAGNFSNYRTITYNANEAYATLAFSENNRFLYAGNGITVKQFDLWAPDITTSSETLVVDTAAYPLLGEMVLMPDKKIYVAGQTTWGECLSVIDSPDLKFPDCSFHLRSKCIPGSNLILTAPNFPNYSLSVLPNSGCDTLASILDAQVRASEYFKIAPNPALEEIVISYKDLKLPCELVVLNLLGQMVHREVVNVNSGLSEVRIKTLPKGTYLVYVTEQTEAPQTRRFVKL